MEKNIMTYQEELEQIRQWEKVSDANEIVNILRQLNDMGDVEVSHSVADTLLCNLLESLGYKEIVEAYRDVDKWYA